MNSLSNASKPAPLETVLVLEDDVLVRMPICQYLRDCGYQVAAGVAQWQSAAIQC